MIDLRTTALSLDGDWELYCFPPEQQPPTHPSGLVPGEAIPARVPGNFEIDLHAHGIIPDPLVRDHVYDLEPYEYYSWWMQRTFEVAGEADAGERELVFDGIDCIAEVWLNGVSLGQARNMLISHRFSVGALLKAGRNTVAVRFFPTITEARKYEVPPGEFTPFFESLNIRKAPHMFGWDIMPRLLSGGLWRSVRLETLPPVRFTSVAWHTVSADAGRGVATIQADWQIADPGCSVRAWTISVTLLDGESVFHQQEFALQGAHGRIDLTLAEVRLWWPRGAGEAHLYTARLCVRRGDGVEVARNETALGIRTIYLHRTDLTSREEPGEFCFKVNGEKIFIRGTNWVQLDGLHSRDGEHLPKALALLTELNCNMVRCWGGNVYEDHGFYDFCDREGIMVWQDFTLSCGVYPQTDEFARVLTAEAEAVVRKLRNHPSLAIWCGDNEGDDAQYWRFFPRDPETDRPTRQVLPAVVRRWDPFRQYLPSSPYQGPSLHRARDQEALLGNGEHPYHNHAFHAFRDLEGLPEVHCWWPFKGSAEKYRDYKGSLVTESLGHFISEMGYSGCPSRATLEKMIAPEYLWPWKDNPKWQLHGLRPTLTHTDHDGRVEIMADMIRYLFDQEPDTLDDFILASQLVQAEGMKFIIEKLRSEKGRRTGILWWNLRDGWPQIGLAVVDYYYDKKLAYHHIRQSQQTICLMVGEAVEGRHAIHAVNDSLVAVEGTYRITGAESAAGIQEGRFAVAANSTAVIGQLGAPEVADLWLIEWSVDGGGEGCNHYLAGPRPIPLESYRRWLPALRYSA